MKRSTLLWMSLAAPASAWAQVPAAQNFSQVPAAPGAWSYNAQGGVSEARFMDSSGTIRLFVRCTMANRLVTLSRTSSAPASSLSVWTDTMERGLAARFDPNGMRVTGALHSTDRLLDAIAFSRGRVAVTMPGFPPLVLVAGPEAARVFEDCRN